MRVSEMSRGLISLLGPALFFVNNENHKKKESFNTTRKIVLFLRNTFLLLARLGAIVSAIFFPVISQWKMFVGNAGADAADRLDDHLFEVEFNRYFRDGLHAVSDDVGRNSTWFIGFIFFHFFIVAVNGVLSSPKFLASSMRERWLHLVSSFWIPLPFLTLKGVDRGEEKSELWFLIVLHTCENIGILLVSRWAYLPDYPLGLLLVQLTLLTVNVVALILSVVKKQPSQGSRFVWFYLLILVSFNVLAIFAPRFFSDFEIGLFVIDAILMLSNLLGVALSIFYAKKIELYANVPESVPNLPSYGPEVNLTSSLQ